MLKFVTGDFFDYEVDIRINTVNCVGVMGAGVALEFRNRYPEMFKDYVEVCKNKNISPENPHIWTDYNLISTCTIINLPTKIHWKNPSKYEYIEKNLEWLEKYLSNKNKMRVTLPALGCGHGGLDWNRVKEMITRFLGKLDAEIFVFDPSSSKKNSKKEDWTDKFIQHSIFTVFPNDDFYPKGISENSKLPFFCFGNKSLLKEKKISILANLNSSEKEATILSRVLKYIPIDEAVLLLSLKNKNDYDFAEEFLKKGFKMIFIIPYGILKFEVQKAFPNKLDKNKVLVISTTSPDQQWKVYESSNALKLRQRLADITLINSNDLMAVKSLVKYLKKPFKNLYYINYWNEQQEVFNFLSAEKIKIDDINKKVNIDSILKKLKQIN